MALSLLSSAIVCRKSSPSSRSVESLPTKSNGGGSSTSWCVPFTEDGLRRAGECSEVVERLLIKLARAPDP